MANSNETTLGVYERNFDKYVEGTGQVTNLEHMQGRWIADVLSLIPKDGKILEIGSAMGRDARFMRELGYNPEATDAFDAAITYMNANGLEARKLNVLTDEIDESYDLVLACAVFLHFTEEEFRDTLVKLRNNLTPNGLIAFTVKNGSGESWQDHKMGEARYFQFWNHETIADLLEITKYSILDEQMSEEGKWLHIIARPKE